MLESLKKVIEDTEDFTKRVNKINERLELLVKMKNEENLRTKKLLDDVERGLNDLIFDQKNKPAQKPADVRNIRFPIGAIVSIGSVVSTPGDAIKCLYEALSEQDRMKPMGLSCSCPRCSSYALYGDTSYAHLKINKNEE